MERKCEVQLREVLRDDLPIFFEHQQDHAAYWMVAFLVEDPSDRGAFDEKWAKILADESNINRTILVDGQVAGRIASFLAPWSGHIEVGCNWGRMMAAVLILYAIATVGSVGGLLVWSSGRCETVGVGLLVPLAALPALFVYVWQAKVKVRPLWRHVAFWCLFLPVPILLLVSYIEVASRPSSDDGGQMAIALMVPILSGGILAYLIDLATGISTGDPWSRSPES